MGARLLRMQKVRGSNPLISTTSEWTTLHSKSPAEWLGIFRTARSFLLSAKSHTSPLLLACKRAHDASAALPTFFGGLRCKFDSLIQNHFHVALTPGKGLEPFRAPGLLFCLRFSARAKKGPKLDHFCHVGMNCAIFKKPGL